MDEYYRHNDKWQKSFYLYKFQQQVKLILNKNSDLLGVIGEVDTE